MSPAVHSLLWFLRLRHHKAEDVEEKIYIPDELAPAQAISYPSTAHGGGGGDEPAPCRFAPA